MVGSIFSKVRFKILFVAKLCVGSEGKMFDDMSNFIDLGTLSVSHASTEKNLNIHNAGTRNVY